MYNLVSTVILSFSFIVSSCFLCTLVQDSHLINQSINTGAGVTCCRLQST